MEQPERHVRHKRIEQNLLSNDFGHIRAGNIATVTVIEQPEEAQPA